MSWTEKNIQELKEYAASSERTSVLDEAKKEAHPEVLKEVSSGNRPFEPIQFQPFRGVGYFEGEFGLKGRDLIVHFWPEGYHQADRSGAALPAFSSKFMPALNDSADKVYEGMLRLIAEDRDMGAIFLKVYGEADNHFYRKRIEMLLMKLYNGLGGNFP